MYTNHHRPQLYRVFPCLLLALLLTLSGCGPKTPGNNAQQAASAVSQAAASTTSQTDATLAQAAASASQAASSASAAAASAVSQTDATQAQAAVPDEDGSYTTKEDVALYIHTYGKLPANFITKSRARDLGWEASAGNLGDVAPGMSIGGDRFGNREGLLPEKKGRQYYECDIDYTGGRRNAKRIVYSDDGLVFYTDDHYASFEQLY